MISSSIVSISTGSYSIGSGTGSGMQASPWKKSVLESLMSSKHSTSFLMMLSEEISEADVVPTSP